jgi:hypothetical protein
MHVSAASCRASCVGCKPVTGGRMRPPKYGPQGQCPCGRRAQRSERSSTVSRDRPLAHIVALAWGICYVKPPIALTLGNSATLNAYSYNVPKIAPISHNRLRKAAEPTRTEHIPFLLAVHEVPRRVISIARRIAPLQGAAAAGGAFRVGPYFAVPTTRYSWQINRFCCPVSVYFCGNSDTLGTI